MKEVQKVDNLSYKDFVKNFVEPGIPVVFKNASKAWKANGLFTPEYFRKNFGDRRTTVSGKEYSISEMLDLIEKSSAENPAPYPCKFNVHVELPELLPLLHPLNMNYAQPNYFENTRLFPAQKWGNDLEVFLGGPGGKFPFAHIDYYHTNAWITQVYGEKNFVVFPPGQDKYMYATQEGPWKSPVNIFNPDYEKHPEFKHATPITVKLEPGETIFVPNGTWHTAESLTPGISIVYDQLTRSNFKNWFNDLWVEKKQGGKLKSIAFMAYALGARSIFEIRYALKSKKN